MLFCSQAIDRRRLTRGGRDAGRWLDPAAGLNGKKERLRYDLVFDFESPI